MLYLNTIKTPLFNYQVVRDKEVLRDVISRWRRGFSRGLFIEKDYRYGVLSYRKVPETENIYALSYGKNLQDRMLYTADELDYQKFWFKHSSAKELVLVGYFDAYKKFRPHELYARIGSKYEWDSIVDQHGVSYISGNQSDKCIDIIIAAECNALFIPHVDTRKFYQAALLKL
jgi:hypothetical protein